MPFLNKIQYHTSSKFLGLEIITESDIHMLLKLRKEGQNNNNNKLNHMTVAQSTFKVISRITYHFLQAIFLPNH